MGRNNQSGREQKLYAEDFPEITVQPLNCVPEKRSKGTWTNGVLAWQRATASENAKIVGWLHPPRFRNQNHHNRVGPNPRFTPQQKLHAELRAAGIMEEE